MKAFLFLLSLLILAACTDSRETRLQRFLIQSNTMAGDHQEEQAEYYLKEAIKIDSCFADAWNNLGTLYFKQKKYAEALGYYDQALSCRSNFLQASFNRANTAYELKEYYKALNDVEKIIKLKPDTSIAWFMAGLNQTRLRAFDKSLASFERALALDSGNVEILVNIGTVYYYLKSYDKAKEYLQRALAKDAEEPNTYNALAMIEIELGEYNQAKRLINRSLALRPGDPFFLNNSGYAKLLTNDLEAGREDIDRSIIEDPDNAWAYRNKGLYYLLSKRYDEAIRLLQQSLKMDPFTEKVNLYLGEAYLANGNKSEACKYFEEAYGRKELQELAFSKTLRSKMRLERVAEYLLDRLSQPLPAAAAHNMMRATAIGNLRPKFDHANPPRPGSVLILLYQDGNEVRFPLIRRQEYAGAHSGQISLPGGKSEGDETSSQTALREAEEEVGVKRDLPTVVGLLSNFLVIPSNFMITPVIATIPSVPIFKPDPYEVAGIINGSLSSLLEESAIYREEIVVGQYTMMAPHFKVDGAIVWGATAMMLNELRVVLKDL